jgi:cytochrome o ubiquinol oxidase subunit 3
MSEHSVQSIDPGSIQLWAYDDTGHDPIGTRSIGFWLYMMSDAMIFAALFAAHGTYLHNYAGGPTAQDVIHFTGAAWETLFLFASVLAYGFGMVALKHGSCTGVVKWLFVSFLLGIGFLLLEYQEFSGLAEIGAVPQRSGFLSDYWGIILTHGLHVFFGLLWMLVMIIQVMSEGFSQSVVGRLLTLKQFWHFQAVIWVCVFTFVYLMGGL